MLQINVISRANHEDRLWKSLSQRLPVLTSRASDRDVLGPRSVALRTLTSHTRWRRVGISYGDESTQSQSGMTASKTESEAWGERGHRPHS